MENIKGLMDILKSLQGDVVFTCKICHKDLEHAEREDMIAHLMKVHGWKKEPTFNEMISNFTSGFKAKEGINDVQS